MLFVVDFNGFFMANGWAMARVSKMEFYSHFVTRIRATLKLGNCQKDGASCTTAVKPIAKFNGWIS
jgi:hypothetical protein